MIRKVFALGVAAALPAAAAAQTESRVSADLSSTLGYSNNPFTTTGSNAGAAVATIDIAPRYELSTPHSTVTISAEANLQQYFSKYSRNDSYSGAIDYNVRPSERVTGHARIDLSSSVLGAFNSYLPLAANVSAFTPTAGSTTDVTGVTGPTASLNTAQPLPITTPLVPYTDVGLFGLRNRRRMAEASGDLGVVLSARNTINFSGFAQLTRYDNLAGGDYEDYGGSVGFQHAVSSRLRLGVTGSASTDHYHNGFDSTQVYSVQATASGRINDRWSADGALGVSFVQGGTQRSTSSTSLSGNIDVCRRGSHSSLCAQAVRSVSPTGFAGTQYVTTGGISWNRQLDARQNVSLSGSYSKVGSDTQLYAGGPVANGLPLQTQYVQATAGYYRRLGYRLGLVTSINYRQLLGNNAGRTADYGGQIGLSYRLGDRR